MNMDLLNSAGNASTKFVLVQPGGKVRNLTGPFMTSRGNPDHPTDPNIPGTYKQVEKIVVSPENPNHKDSAYQAAVNRGKQWPGVPQVDPWQPFGSCRCGLGATLEILGEETKSIQATRVKFSDQKVVTDESHPDILRPLITEVVAWQLLDDMKQADIDEFNQTATMDRKAHGETGNIPQLKKKP